ncbi:tetratricopeptide repeat protein [Oceanimonas sp. CHS3-5]|uniref:tetratricopeptide repeat protein n=1 Tax=Oceanimonas sp. CHS3-5 TaxID=3068186 RepID=UPI00273F01B8|nr:tetratricopeptide repeat protein [Oceanimonas sp. CHS3-5]MDP5291766.1 tetratricopeptide repeat protein [Oceanimonas sp. CHS3-5]
MRVVSGVILLALSGTPALAQNDKPDWQDPVWAEVMSTPPAASELAISEVAYSRSERLAESQKAADLALAAGDWAGAEGALAGVLAEFPDAHDLRLKLASLQYGRGALNEAKHLLQQGIELALQQPELRLTLARILASENRHAATWKVLDGAEPALAEHLDYYGLKAEAGRRSGRCDAAVSLYHRLLAQQDSGPWWLGLGLCQRTLGRDFTAAFEQARASVDLGVASLQFVNQQLEQHGTTQTH